MHFFDPMYFLFVAPAFLLGLWAQMRIRTSYAQAQQMPAPLSGAAAARHILDSAGLTNVAIEEIPGELTDHYDPRDKVLRLSAEVYESRTLAAVGIAAHESGHALQDAQAYAPLGHSQRGRADGEYRQRHRHVAVLLGAGFLQPALSGLSWASPCSAAWSFSKS